MYTRQTIIRILFSAICTAIFSILIITYLSISNTSNWGFATPIIVLVTSIVGYGGAALLAVGGAVIGYPLAIRNKAYIFVMPVITTIGFGIVALYWPMIVDSVASNNSNTAPTLITEEFNSYLISYLAAPIVTWVLAILFYIKLHIRKEARQ